MCWRNEKQTWSTDSKGRTYLSSVFNVPTLGSPSIKQREPYRGEGHLKFSIPQQKGVLWGSSSKALPDLTFYDFITWWGYQNHTQNNTQRPIREHKMCLRTSFPSNMPFLLKIDSALMSVEMPRTAILNTTSSNNIYLKLKCLYYKFRTMFF